MVFNCCNETSAQKSATNQKLILSIKKMKSDLRFERMLSSKFGTNSLLLAFNVLRILGQSVLTMEEALPRKFNVPRRMLP